jgi:four helix bundle protein
VSIASNIGEGRRRRSQRALLYHLDVALGSQGEVEVQLEIARRIGLLAEDDYQALRKQAEEVGRMLNGLIASFERSN